ncbi:hypothetical protein [Chryseosolibacter indicus]|uniref:Uncharacterized protein n=1 Tax=Chryseosolibacter indicus TaxID=2782351 RepID=A0ABS5VMH9_9BACT|nr:hypothetical protein [Chryseosolibacter indicus]MBT1702218.1 hypothetical protein [Chryseosolibacter indicus]
MLPYKIKFIIEDKKSSEISFESNEKPVKGEIYTIQNVNGKIEEVRLTEVNKVIVRTDTSEAILEYRCKTEKHEATATTIGFGKRD